jgi:hypothetical protein
MSVGDCWRHARRVLGCLSLALAASSCGFIPASERVSMTYVLRAEVEVDGALIKGSAIQSVDVVGTDGGFPAEQTTLDVDWYGEAIDLSDDSAGRVFVLMETRNGGGGYGDLLLRKCGIIDRFRGGTAQVQAVAAFHGTCTVEGDSVPLVVVLKDAKDPRTLVDLSEAANISVRKVTLTRTEVQVAITMPQKYGWLASSDRYSVAAKPRSFLIFRSAFYRERT